MVIAQSTTEEKVPITVTPRTASGADAPVEGPLTFEVLSGGATVEYDGAASQLSFFVVSEDAAGNSQIRFTADADLGAGVAAISEVVDYSYTSPMAASLGAVAGAPVPKVAP